MPRSAKLAITHPRTEAMLGSLDPKPFAERQVVEVMVWNMTDCEAASC